MYTTTGCIVQPVVWSVSEKVSQLNAVLDDPAFPRVTYRRGSSGVPVPVLAGSGIRVQAIVIANQKWHESADEIAAQYELPVRLIEEALNFYQEHQAEIDHLIQIDTHTTSTKFCND